ncbi:hypothetical protein O0I10_006232 [Lichtheimia ornata]|uniref:F-box domain-containing protein n=1 Tax=Lichtheimia ornata TaxID=688661 RepID=A0AAD7V3M7_9FUNG|nr:uncharacterized protein O0I10_006232 [Lichtheimia ornata]KAJ8657961.1 hypothetical protein O0I10_006232 [Lichtheimia ornata]
MTCSIWKDSCNQPTLTASSQKYAQLVHDSNTQLHQSLEPVLSALDRRAIGLSKCANFEAALHDAKLMQQLSPSSSLGYIREADIYSEQGKQRQVVDICSKGMTVVDAMDEHYDDLKRAKMDAEQRQNTRIDFVRQLPLDIVMTMLIPMFMDRFPLRPYTPCSYLYVSNLWRDRVIQCFDGLHFMVGSQNDYNADTLSQVIQFAQHTKTLYISLHGRGTWLGDLLRNNDFCSLWSLSIGQCLNDHVDNFVSSLKSISKTLTHLGIKSPSSHLSLPMATILLTCPHLVSLELSRPVVADLSSLPMTTWPDLKKLTIYGAKEPITCEQTIGIWRRFPSLNHLGLHPCSDMQSALVVSDYLPSTNDLKIHLSNMGTVITFMNHGTPSQTPRITKIAIDGFVRSNDGAIVEIGSVLKQHRETLEDFKWNMNVKRDNRDIYDLHYPRLKKLILDKSGWWIPRNAPLLEELILSSQTTSQQPSALDTIPPKLKRLVLDLKKGSNAVNVQAIKRYLLRFNQHSHLQELIIRTHTMEDIGNMVDATYCLNQLQRLAIHVTRRSDSNRRERVIDQLVRGCPNLTCFEINGEYGLSTHSINALQQLGNLKKCSFSIDRSNEDGIWQALETFTQLQCIRIYPVIPSNLASIRSLKEKRPDMTIFLDQTFTRF